MGKAFQSALSETDEPSGMLSTEILNGFGHKDLVGCGFIAQSESKVHGNAKQVIVVRDRFASVDADPNPKLIRSFQC